MLPIVLHLFTHVLWHQGSYGVVFYSTHPTTNQPLALKKQALHTIAGKV